jgi:hypothetical protein
MLGRNTLSNIRRALGLESVQMDHRHVVVLILPAMAEALQKGCTVAHTCRITHETSNHNQNLNMRKIALQAETEQPASMLCGVYLHCFG